MTSIGLVALWGSFGCSAPAASSACSTGVVRQAVTNGGASESYWGFAPEEARSIVLVEDVSQPRGAVCTGTFVSPSWVVTARHCLDVPALRVRVPTETDPGVVDVQPIRIVRHADLDVALLELPVAASDVGAASVRPMQILPADDPALMAGEPVEIAGYGLTESGSVRQLHYAIEPLKTVQSDALEVDGTGRSGACEGDSGGPLLVRASNGSPALAGVSSMGSANCRGTDTYVRTSTISDWIASEAQAMANPTVGCGQIDAEGRCFSGTAMWCESGRLDTERCATDRPCGWDDSANGYRCLGKSADPCQGAGPLGICRDGQAWRCEHGHLTIEQCCGSCVLVPATGQAACSGEP